jgi:hypothetical protein
MANGKTFDVKVRNITETKVRKEDEDKEVSRCLARDTDGSVQIIITSPKGFFEGYNAGDVIKVTLSNTQKTLKESTKKKDEE